MNSFKQSSLILAMVLITMALFNLVSKPDRAESGSLESAYLEATTGFKAMATTTLSIGSSTAQIVGTIPTGCHHVEVFVSQDMNFGPSTVATGVLSPYIPASSSKIFSGLDSLNPTIYMVPRSAEVGTATIRAY